MNIATMRQAVADSYPRRGWKKKVQQMPDEQVLAIYKRLEGAGELRKHDSPVPDIPRMKEHAKDDRPTIDIDIFGLEKNAAIEALQFLRRRINTNGFATVKDYYNYIKVPLPLRMVPPSWSEEYGWNDLTNAFVYQNPCPVSVRGWIISLPEPRYLLDDYQISMEDVTIDKPGWYNGKPLYGTYNNPAPLPGSPLYHGPNGG